MKFNTVNYKEHHHLLSVSSQCGGSNIVSLACISSMCFVQCFLAVNLFIEPLDYYFTPITPPP